MASQYHSLFTKQGLDLLRTAIQSGTKLGITHMSYGDGGGVLPEPNDEFKKMVNEVYRTPLNRLAPSKDNPNWLEADGVIPSAVGGFNIREVGLWAGDVMVAYANYPPTYKPSADQGTAQIKTIRIVLQIDNTANFELKIDASVVMATVEYLEDNIKEFATFKPSIDQVRQHQKKKLSEALILCGNSFFYSSEEQSLQDDGCMTVLSDEGVFYKRGLAGKIRLSFFGEKDDATSAFNRLFKWVKTVTSSYVDNGQGIRKIDVDLEGQVWELDSSIYGIQGISGLNFVNGHIKAKSTFIGNYLIEFTDAEALRAYHYISFNHVVFDGNRVANCARFNRLLKSGVTTCHFIRWKANGYGLVVGKTPTDTLGAGPEAHEFFVNGQCSFAQYDYSAIYAGQICSGTALYINTYDGHYSDFFIAATGRGIEHIKCGLNMFNNIHIYGVEQKNYGFFVDCTNVNPFLNLNDIYLDECSFRALNPNQIIFTNNKVFRNDDSKDGLMIFDTSIQTNSVKRMIITENHFNTAQISGKDQIQFVTDSGGSWQTGGEHDIQSFANTNLGYVNLYQSAISDQTDWRKWNGYTLSGRYIIDVSGTFNFDISQYHKSLRTNDKSAVPSEWLIAATWQSTNGSTAGMFRLTVFRLPSGVYTGIFEPVGTSLKSTSTYKEETIEGVLTKTVATVTDYSLPTGFLEKPTMTNAGIVTVKLDNFYRGAIYRNDSRNLNG